MKIRCQGSERLNLQCHLEIVEWQRCPPPGGPFATDPFLDLLCKKTSKSWSCFAFFGGDVGQKPGFQKTNQIEDILGLILQEELLRIVWYLGLLYSFSRGNLSHWVWG